MSTEETRERRLREIRAEAAASGHTKGAGVRPGGSPMPVASPESGYYGLPVIKQHGWTWEIPMYFFVGGVAGASAVLAQCGALFEGNRSLSVDARRIAAVGSLASGALLVSDLGRPERFLNMLRVFKPRSPMSVGAWTVAVFSSAAAAAAFADFIEERYGRGWIVLLIRAPSGVVAAASGLVMSTYTGVLIGATTTPVWSANSRLLPIHFGAAALGSAAGVLELIGHSEKGLHRLGLVGSAIETAIGATIELTKDRAGEPLRKGQSGTLTRIGGVLSGPLPLALRLLGGHSRRIRKLAALSTVVGTLVTRFAWLEAGKVSATDNRLQLQG